MSLTTRVVALRQVLLVTIISGLVLLNLAKVVTYHCLTTVLPMFGNSKYKVCAPSTHVLAVRPCIRDSRTPPALQVFMWEQTPNLTPRSAVGMQSIRPIIQERLEHFTKMQNLDYRASQKTQVVEMNSARSAHKASSGGSLLAGDGPRSEHRGSASDPHQAPERETIATASV